MPAFQHIPLGTPVPNSPHAVVVSLPTMADVIGYEERLPETMSLVRTGYPRFLRHPFVEAAARRSAAQRGVPANEALFPVESEAAALRIAQFIGKGTRFNIVEEDGWALLHFPKNETANVAHIGKLIQHTGVGLTSRQAEDWLAANGGPARSTAETLADIAPQDAAAAVLRALAPWLAPAQPQDSLCCRSGMNAFYAAFEAVRAVQRPRGRGIWLQLGWLYTDTTETLRKCLAPGEGERFEVLYDVLDKAAIERFFADHGDQLAGVVTEVPTNPLIRSPDVAHLLALARHHGALLVFDPSTSGLVNVNLLPWCDVLVTSLTKYAAHEGDVMLGALAVNPASPFHAPLLDAAQRHHSPPYWRDAARLALEIETMPQVVAAMNANTRRLAASLRGKPGVRRVLWSREDASAANYARIARTPDSDGCMLTLELDDPLPFYDRICVVKGPSFGTSFTIVSPFIYMAHYDLVTDAEKHAQLAAAGVDPKLMRVSLGTEPFDQIADEFSRGMKR
jgi:cystathionine gamma-synthase